jgi:hypothetical protein
VPYGQSHCRNSAIGCSGSGITVYIAIGYALTVNISIDEIPVSQVHFDGVYGCCTTTVRPVYNLTLYDVQFLPLGNHALTLRLLDTSGYLYNGAGSVFVFDYAVITGTDLATPHPPSRKRLGPAIGGALGGTAAVSLAALAVFHIGRRTRHGGAEGTDHDNPVIVSDKQEQEQPVIPESAGLHHDSAPVSPFGEGSDTRATAAHELHAEGEVPLTTPSHSTSTSYPPPHNESSTPPTPISRAEEESQLLARMYKLGIPTREITRITEIMRGQNQIAQGAGSGALPEIVNEPWPPGYEL